MLALIYIQFKVRNFLDGVSDYCKYIWGEIRNEGKNDDEWIFVQMEAPRLKLGSSK